MPTYKSGLEPYLTPAEFVVRVDARAIGDRLKDDGTRVAAGSLASDPNLAVLLMQASGMVEAALTRGGRYTPGDSQNPGDLTLLTGNSKELLKGLVAGLTLMLIYNRRPDPTRPFGPTIDWAMKTLQALEDGVLVFGIVESQQAGYRLPVLTPTGTAPTLQQTVTQGASRFFGNLSDRG